MTSDSRIPAGGPSPSVPRHVAIIMDGNGRWATARRLPRFAGHAKGVEAVKSTVNACLAYGVEYLTLFAFSSENWRRPADEVSVLMRLFVAVLEREIVQMRGHGIRLRVVGATEAFEPRLRSLIDQAHSQTGASTRLNLTICANYGGRWDVVQAAQAMLKARPDLAADPALITEEGLAPYLSMAYAPEPDLFIRTGGEQRISNFMLWQLAYTELYFTEAYWPDFGRVELERALESFQTRERRFGRTSAQIKNPASAS